jgi:hypothetical protein
MTGVPMQLQDGLVFSGSALLFLLGLGCLLTQREAIKA